MTPSTGCERAATAHPRSRGGKPAPSCPEEGLRRCRRGAGSSRAPVATTPTAPSGVSMSAACTTRRKSLAKPSNAPAPSHRIHKFGRFAQGATRRSSNGLRSARTPHALAARAKGRNTWGKMCVCLCVSRWETAIPAACSLQICAVTSASISRATSLPLRAAAAKPVQLLRKPTSFRDLPIRLGTCEASSTGSPSTSTTWQPTLRPCAARASRTASSNSGPFAISVAEVTTPCSCASTMARFTPTVKPKSSALMMRRRTAPV